MAMMIFSTIIASIDDHLLHTAFTAVTFPIAPPSLQQMFKNGSQVTSIIED